MGKLFLFCLCFQWNWSLSQEIVTGHILINGKVFELSDSNLSIQFQPLKAKLSKTGEKYLKGFADYYKTVDNNSDTLVIEINPCMTLKEEKIVNNGIGVARVVAVRDYLAKYGISVSKGKINTVITKESVVDIR
ncbi:MAG: hypothetical protein ACK514_06835 [Bacteroidota bacterium]|jgi:outer membrane protein OmpA-like peptidoglycan-associated protein|nr:hypothetical protein [Cytophagales bacterium]MCE2958499.1 hypothetical protein [Flammeovirgaceae bacterium]MCZ8069083.1 hypothetical protein [Cytophagales bacterium]